MFLLRSLLFGSLDLMMETIILTFGVLSCFHLNLHTRTLASGVPSGLNPNFGAHPTASIATKTMNAKVCKNAKQTVAPDLVWVSPNPRGKSASVALHESALQQRRESDAQKQSQARAGPCAWRVRRACSRGVNPAVPTLRAPPLGQVVVLNGKRKEEEKARSRISLRPSCERFSCTGSTRKKKELTVRTVLTRIVPRSCRRAHL